MINSIENKNLPVWLGWALLIVGVVGYLLVQLTGSAAGRTAA